MPKLHFVNGMVKELTEDQYAGFLKRFNNSALKYWGDRNTGDIVPFTSPSICFIEREMPDGHRRPNEREREVETADVDEGDVEADSEPEQTQEERGKDIDPAEAVMKEIIAKSDCGKSGHKGQKQIIYKQVIMTGKRGQKKVPSTRYYPICEFCGQKGRFIAADKLSDELKEAALPHKED